ncbi:hypothetical protein EVAR_54494_1 [Eumeta japonica]|uniref:Uncharacterized protein n=1 Tax=Eumeta variegata TaxID=151549 RepID=A0A4C1YGA2_EUMVA|nr:hypothetical protein EVAR_54494_1 [Eumeta japonica]
MLFTYCKRGTKWARVRGRGVIALHLYILRLQFGNGRCRNNELPYNCVGTDNHALDSNSGPALYLAFSISIPISTFNSISRLECSSVPAIGHGSDSDEYATHCAHERLEIGPRLLLFMKNDRRPANPTARTRTDRLAIEAGWPSTGWILDRCDG